MEETRLFFFSGKKLNHERDSPVQSKYDERIIPSRDCVVLLASTGKYRGSNLIKPFVTSDRCRVIEL